MQQTLRSMIACNVASINASLTQPSPASITLIITSDTKLQSVDRGSGHKGKGT